LSTELTSLLPFDCKSDTATIGTRWRRWRRSFDYFLVAKGVTQPAQRKALLLHMAGVDVQDIYETLTEVQGDDDEYVNAVRALDDYFQPRTNIPYERHLFRQLHQRDNESVDQFVTRLRQQADFCSFEDQKDDNIRDQLIDKCKSAILRKQLLEKREVTLLQALEMARAKEVAERQAATMATNCVGQPEVNALRSKFDTRPSVQKKQGGKKGKCFRCGHEGHYAKDKECPAKRETCRKCHKVGHYQSQCKTRSSTGSTSYPQPSYSNRRVNTIETGTNGDEEYAFMVNTGNSCSGCIDICVGGVSLPNVLIDSGASCNLVDRNTWEGLKRQQIACKSEKSTKQIYAYGSQVALKTLGKFTTFVEVGSCKTQAEFVVVDGQGKSILGRDTAIELNVLRVGRPEVNTVEIEYPGLFSGVGKHKDYKAKLHIDPDVKPVAQPMRRIPFALRHQVEAEIQNLLDQDIIEPVQGPTPWVSPVVVVPKASGVRLCVDMRQANEAIIRERHPIPTVDEVLEDLNQSTVFSKLDLRLGFHQIELHEDSRYITTFITHVGLFRYKRMLFGVNSAPELYQHIIRQVLQDCPGTANIADDIIVHGKDEKQHDERLERVFRRLADVGLTLNKDKCQLRLNHLEFMGHLLTDRGIGPTQARVEAVLKAREPVCASEVRSFLGLVNFSAKFIPDLAAVSEPLRKLCRQNVTFEWNQEQKQAFTELKSRLSNAQTLAYFDRSAPTQVIADAGPVGLGAVLVQWQNNEWRVVYYASRSLTDVERRYSQTEREALSLVWACDRFHVYLGGMEFTLVTDHKPLEIIYGKRFKPSARIERWVLRLQQYNFKVVYRTGRENIADALSRLTQQNTPVSRNVAEEYVHFIAQQAAPQAISIQEIEKESDKDSDLEAVRQARKSGDWSKCNTSIRAVRDEITTVGRIVLRGTRIIIPKALQQKTIQVAHEGHQGIVKTKARLRTKVWFPLMDKMAEQLCQSCHECQLVGQPQNPEPMTRTELPQGAWQHLAADLLGPLPNGDYLFVVVDYFSRFVEVRIVKSTTSLKLIHCLEDIFAVHGLPLSLKTDNAQNLTSREFNQYLKDCGIQHKTSIPLWPQSNGEVERQNRSLLKYMKIVYAQGKDIKTELHKYLLAYRTTPHSTTGMTPAEMLFRRKVRTKLPELQLVETTEYEWETTRLKDQETKQKGKYYSDTKRRAESSDIKPGDKVLLKQQQNNKLSLPFSPALYTVVNKHGQEITVKSEDGVTYRRNVAHLKKYCEPAVDAHQHEQSTPSNNISETTPETLQQPRDCGDEQRSDERSTDETVGRGNNVDIFTRSGRHSRKPTHLKDYHLS